MYRIIRATAIFGAMLASVAAAPAAMAGPMPTLGTTSQPVGHYEFCQRYGSMCGENSTTAPVHLSRQLWTRLIAVNKAVNTNVFPQTDQEIFGRAEHWDFPASRGDCEDFVLLKQYMLEREGIPASALLITVVRQTNGEGHAVLTVRTDAGDYVLDNLDNRILRWTETDYQYLKRQSERHAGTWVEIADDRNMYVGSVSR